MQRNLYTYLYVYLYKIGIIISVKLDKFGRKDDRPDTAGCLAMALCTCVFHSLLEFEQCAVYAHTHNSWTNYLYIHSLQIVITKCLFLNHIYGQILQE